MPTVENVSISARTKMAQNGTTITFSSDETISLGDNFGLMFEDKEHYFEVNQVDIKHGKLLVKATEIGYYAKRFDRQKIDIRELLNLPIESITDPAKLRQIQTESGWC